MKPYSITLLRKAIAHIRCGGVIAYPTESCYGLGCDPFNYKAIKSIINLKGRNPKKGLIVIASRTSQLKNLVILPDNLNDVNRYWPGPYTLLLRKKHNNKIPHILHGKHVQIAVRVSAHKLVCQLCNFLNIPLVSTSANYSGCKSAKNYADCKRLFGNKVLVLPGRTSLAKRPSTIIDWESGRILR